MIRTSGRRFSGLAISALFAASAHAAPANLPALGDVGEFFRRAQGATEAPAVGAAEPLWENAALQAIDNPWKRVTAPTRSAPEVIGNYSSGCLRGGAPLEASGPNHHAMRLSRRRFYGHPRLVSYLRDLAQRVGAEGLGTLFVGDLGQPRGGPTLSGHVSHQNGLDVDVWLRLGRAGENPTDAERETWETPDMVIAEFQGLNRDWDPRVVELLRLSAQSPDVERVLINPVIKREVCRKYPGAAWLSKIRPYYFHADHFHARLKCPPGNSRCRPQEPVPGGDGCGAELAEWFTPAREAEARRMRADTTPPRMPNLPDECARVLREP